jgi:hypothetical protein
VARLTAIVSIAVAKRAFGNYLASSRLGFKSTGGNRGHGKEIEEDCKASPEIYEAGRAEATHQIGRPDRIA